MPKKHQHNFSEKSAFDLISQAKRKSLKITFIYFLFGCAWIILTDLYAKNIFKATSILSISIVKGLFYVIITALLIYSLIYPTLKKILVAQETIKKVNLDLEKSNTLYKGLYIEFEKKQALLKALINSIPDLIFYKDVNSVYLGCNKAFETFAGKQESDIIGKTDFDVFDKETALFFRKMDLEMMNNHLPRRNEEEVAYPDGTRVFLDTLKTPYYLSADEVVGLIGVSRDITEKKIKESEILFLNHHDLLTGLYNRRFLQVEQKRLDNDLYLPLSVISGDINGLKLINDSFGHAEGDAIIIEISKILQECCGRNSIIARTGGDEFVVLLPKTNSNAVHLIANKIKAACQERSDEKDRGFHFADISLGYATKNSPDESLEKIIKSADDFMYEQKLFEHKSLHSSILSAIKRTMFEKSYETQEHAERMTMLSLELGKVLGLSEQDLIALELLSTLHDIGKISIDKNILTKVGKLTEEEWCEIKKHPEVGYRIAQSSPELLHIADYILSHHERWDGKGYPQGLKGEEIPLLSRIISIVDAFDAMTQDRAYRKAMTTDQAIDEIKNNSGTQFDPEISKVFLEKVINIKKIFKGTSY